MSTEAIDPRYQNYKRTADLKKRLDAMCVKGGHCENQNFKVAIIVGRWHDYIVDKLLLGSLDALNECGIQDTQIDIINAPGAFEIPLVAQVAAEKNQYQALITLGAIIKGDTPHFDYVAGECARGLSEVSRAFNLPIGFGVLTVNNVDQAMARAAEGDANKGREAALAAIEVASLIEQLT